MAIVTSAPTTSSSVRSAARMWMVPPERPAWKRRASRLPSSAGDRPPDCREKRGMVPPRTTSRISRTVGTSPASARRVSRTGPISIPCPVSVTSIRGDTRSTARSPESRRRGSSRARSERVARMPRSSRSSAPWKAPTRTTRLRDSRRIVRIGTAPAISAFDRPHSFRIDPAAQGEDGLAQPGGGPGGKPLDEFPDPQPRRLDAGLGAEPLGAHARFDRKTFPVLGRASDVHGQPVRRQGDPRLQLAQGDDRPVPVGQVQPGVPDRDDRPGHLLPQRSEEGGEALLDLLPGERLFRFLPLRDPHPDFRSHREERADRDPVPQQGERRDVRLETLHRPFRPPRDGKGHSLERQSWAREEDELRPVEGEQNPRLPRKLRQDAAFHRRDVDEPRHENNEG